jgi:hypothetical protein
MSIVVLLRTSSRSDKKYMVKVGDKIIHFGASGYSDYTIHKDEERKRRYDQRHMPREDWSIYGIDTAGFWAKWILWNKPTIDESIRDIEKRFRIKILSDL